MQKIAILGKPNVGKSSLFNRFLMQRVAITSDVSGTTRDVNKKIADFDGVEVELLDTGGIDESTVLFSKIKELSLKAAAQADIILYVVDGKTLPQDDDMKLFYELQALGRPIALVVNKIDNDKEELERFVEFYSFGAKEVFAISVSHNRKVNALKSWIQSLLDTDESDLLKNQILAHGDEDFSLEQILQGKTQEEVDDKTINVAIIGKVNAGKSSLLNSMLQEERAVVSEIAGTTIDPNDETYTYGEHTINFIDTAGLRRRSKIVGIEKYALNRTKKMLENADIALLVIDASEGVTDQDEKIAGLIEQYSLGCLIVLNKWDKCEKSFKEIKQDVRDELRFLHYAPFITVSALTHKRTHKIYDHIIDIYKEYTKRIPTSKLNDVINFATMKHQLPSFHLKRLKIKYVTQYGVKPPRFALVMNMPQGLHFSYKRYLQNMIRQNFGFEGCPVIISARKRGERAEDDEN
ncbi:MAG: ribosome biogenesis GTPase Der [Campylobacterota bacterium]